MKKFSLLLAICLLLQSCLVSCGSKKDPDSKEDDAAVTDTELRSGNYRLAFVESKGGLRLSLLDGETEIYLNDSPARINVISKNAAVEKTVSAPYATVTRNGDTLVAEAVLKSSRGSEFAVKDIYSLSAGAFLVDRTVNVTAVGTDDSGFASSYAIFDTVAGKKSEFEYFIPSVIYKDSSYLPADAIMANIGSNNYVKETRCGTPLSMMRGKTDGYSIALVHVDPEISASEMRKGAATSVSNTQQYGSIGFNTGTNTSVEFIYPSKEAPTSYESKNAVKRYHEVSVDTVQHYRIGIIPDKTELYNDAMVNTYLKAIAMSKLPERTVDLNSVYDANMELYDELYLYYKGGNGTFSAGYPFAVNVKDFDSFYSVSFQLGFIGCQTLVASELIRDGIKNNDAEAIKKGSAILDFWSSKNAFTGKFPATWWYPANGGTAGKSSGYPAFLRCVVDGAEGFLNAVRYAEGSDVDTSEWLGAAKKIADTLVEKQNSDGSFYRAYDIAGRVCTDTEKANYKGDSKLNTPVAVRFLCEMYKYTGEEKYRDAAVRAADFSYNELYLNIGKYIGGTPDNPNVPDKEADIYALYAFSAIYDLTGDEKYYKALEHAAVSSMSWVYTYDFPVSFVLTSEFEDYNIFTEGNTSGWSFIATGRSAVDVFGAISYYEIFKQYIRTGNDSYLRIAALLQNNNKTAMDLDGTKGYKYRGLCLEACGIAEMGFNTAGNGVWLPWISAAFLEPMIKMNDTFGTYDVSAAAADKSPSELKELLK